MERVLDESSTDGAEYRMKEANGRRDAGDNRSLMTARNLAPERARVLCEGFLGPVFNI